MSLPHDYKAIKKEDMIEAINKSDRVMALHDKTWKYPDQGSSQATCPMLDFMFKIEYRPGTLIFIPDVEEKKNGQN